MSITTLSHSSVSDNFGIMLRVQLQKREQCNIQTHKFLAKGGKTVSEIHQRMINEVMGFSSYSVSFLPHNWWRSKHFASGTVADHCYLCESSQGLRSVYCTYCSENLKPNKLSKNKKRMMTYQPNMVEYRTIFLKEHIALHILRPF